MRMQHLPIWYVYKYLRLLFVYKYNVCASLSIYIMCSIIITPIQHIIYIYIYIERERERERERDCMENYLTPACEHCHLILHANAVVKA